MKKIIIALMLFALSVQAAPVVDPAPLFKGYPWSANTNKTWWNVDATNHMIRQLMLALVERQNAALGYTEYDARYVVSAGTKTNWSYISSNQYVVGHTTNWAIITNWPHLGLQMNQDTVNAFGRFAYYYPTNAGVVGSGVGVLTGQVYATTALLYALDQGIMDLAGHYLQTGVNLASYLASTNSSGIYPAYPGDMPIYCMAALSRDAGYTNNISGLTYNGWGVVNGGVWDWQYPLPDTSYSANNVITLKALDERAAYLAQLKKVMMGSKSCAPFQYKQSDNMSSSYSYGGVNETITVYQESTDKSFSWRQTSIDAAYKASLPISILNLPWYYASASGAYTAIEWDYIQNILNLWWTWGSLTPVISSTPNAPDWHGAIIDQLTSNQFGYGGLNPILQIGNEFDWPTNGWYISGEYQLSSTMTRNNLIWPVWITGLWIPYNEFSTINISTNLLTTNWIDTVSFDGWPLSTKTNLTNPAITILPYSYWFNSTFANNPRTWTRREDEINNYPYTVTTEVTSVISQLRAKTNTVDKQTFITWGNYQTKDYGLLTAWFTNIDTPIPPYDILSNYYTNVTNAVDFSLEGKVDSVITGFHYNDYPFDGVWSPIGGVQDMVGGAITAQCSIVHSVASDTITFKDEYREKVYTLKPDVGIIYTNCASTATVWMVGDIIDTATVSTWNDGNLFRNGGIDDVYGRLTWNPLLQVKIWEWREGGYAWDFYDMNTFGGVPTINTNYYVKLKDITTLSVVDANGMIFYSDMFDAAASGVYTPFGHTMDMPPSVSRSAWKVKEAFFTIEYAFTNRF